MLKEQAICPHCGKKKHKIEYSPNEGIKKLDGTWQPLIQSTGHNEWKESWRSGIAIECKCKRFFFVHGFDRENGPLEVVSTLRPEYMTPVFCKNCKQSFNSPNLTCPTCGTNY